MPAGHTAIPHPAALARERVGEAQSRAQREKRSSPIFAHGDHILVDLETRNEPLAVSTKQLPRDGRAGQRRTHTIGGAPVPRPPMTPVCRGPWLVLLDADRREY